jgi:hypothetical protein
MIPGSPESFAGELERDADSTSSHRALGGVSRIDPAFRAGRRHRFFLAVLWRAPERGERRSVLQQAVAHEIQNFIRPNPPSHLGVPAHRVAESLVALKQHAPDCTRPALQHHLDRRMRHVDQENAHDGPFVAPSKAWDRLDRRRLQATEPAFAAMEGRKRFGEVVRIELRPHPIGEVKFGVGALPEQEIRQPLLSAGADDEIDVTKPGLAGDERGERLACRLTAASELDRRIEDRIA